VLEIEISENGYDVLCGIYGTPELMKAMLFLNEGKAFLSKLLNHCIPPIPFPVTPENKQAEWGNFLRSEKDDTYQYTGYGSFLSNLNKFRYFRYFDISSGPGFGGGIVLRKKWIPYLELKRKLENEEESSNSEKEEDDENDSDKMNVDSE